MGKATPKAHDWDEVLQIRKDYLVADFELKNLERDTNSTQLRADLESASRVRIRKAIQASIENGQLVPPITVARIRDGKKSWNEVISGRNRVQAALNAKQSTIRAYVLPGEYTIAEATMIAAGTNNGQIADVTLNDKDFALFKILTNVVTDLQWEAADNDVKCIVTGRMPDGTAMTLRGISDLTGCGGAAISHTQVKNVLCRKSTKRVHRWMVTHNEDGTITLKDPREYDPDKDEARVESTIAAAKKNAATAAKRASEHAAATSASADQVAAAKNATQEDIDTANRRAKEAADAAERAAKAAEATERARNIDSVKERAKEAVDAETVARHNNDDLRKELAIIDKRKDKPSTPVKGKGGSRNAHFVVYPKDAAATADDIVRAIVETFSKADDAAAFLDMLGAALAEKLALNSEAA